MGLVHTAIKNIINACSKIKSARSSCTVRFIALYGLQEYDTTPHQPNLEQDSIHREQVIGNDDEDNNRIKLWRPRH